MEKRFKILAPIALIVVMGLILAPVNLIPLEIPHLDTISHFIVFGVLTYVLSKQMALHKAVVWCVLLALLTEYAQTFIPNRSASLDDLFANYAGIALATLVSWKKRREMHD